MSKKERKLSAAEQKRKSDFEALCAEMEQRGYKKQDLTINIVTANVLAVVVMLPFIIVSAVLFYTINPIDGAKFYIEAPLLMLLLIFVLIILHELIHGITWAFFAKNRFRSISFGFMLSSLSPYCTCSEPMKRWQYIIGAAMPTLLIGFIPMAVAIAQGNLQLFLLAELLLLSGGGDFAIILKVLRYKTHDGETLFYDHPYECGVIAFEKGN